MTDAEQGKSMAPLSRAERLSRAVLLFHDGAPWTPDKAANWLALTGTGDANTRTLCNLARDVRSMEERRLKPAQRFLFEASQNPQARPKLRAEAANFAGILVSLKIDDLGEALLLALGYVAGLRDTVETLSRKYKGDE